MSWEAIGAVGEVLGAATVLITLGYLAVQIRQKDFLVSMDILMPHLRSEVIRTCFFDVRA